MIEILTQAARQVPALVVLCLLVYMFVGSLKAERTAIETIASDEENGISPIRTSDSAEGDDGVRNKRI